MRSVMMACLLHGTSTAQLKISKSCVRACCCDVSATPAGCMPRTPPLSARTPACS
jgi:hypothetical protein